MHFNAIQVYSRSLFTKYSLGLTQFENRHQLNLERTPNIEEYKVQFLERVNKFDPSYEIVPDLKHFLYLISVSPKDIDRVYEFLKSRVYEFLKYNVLLIRLWRMTLPTKS